MAQHQQAILNGVKNYGEETSSYSKIGALIGAVCGLVLGGLIVAFFRIPNFADIENHLPPLFILALVPLFIAAIGAGAGILVGIGTPKFKEKPVQGRLRFWNLKLLKKKQGAPRVVAENARATSVELDKQAL
jgi:MFS family permease